MCIRDSYTLSGCAELACVAPTNPPPGYGTVTGSTSTPTGFNLEVTCDTAAGYEGSSPLVTSCSTGGGEYTLSGCTEIVCTTPADTTGHTVTETELSVADGFNVTSSCAAGYSGTATVAACTASGPYTLSGCTEIVCTTPDDTTGHTAVSYTHLKLPTILRE